jgi:hypothetical protein
MKWWVLVVWGIIFLTGLLILLFRSSDSGEEVIAVHQARTNHRLQASDLQNPGKAAAFLGKYLRKSVLTGETIRSRDVSATPLVFTDPQPWFAVLAEPDAISQGLIDATSKGQLCDHVTVASASSEVVAIICTAPDNRGSCHVIVRIPSEDAIKFGSYLASRAIPDGIYFKPSCK